MAPPRTRGSPLLGVVDEPLHPGSPAHAGIAPRLPTSRFLRPRLPRARGDRPGTSSSVGCQLGAPPRTRGSPAMPFPSSDRVRGSPAHAGIAPCSSRGRPPIPRLPRARGDRPSPGAQRTTLFRAPPRTRGSPLVGNDPLEVSLGSPAHAGIARERRAQRGQRRGLPRARGDRPLPRTAGRSPFAAPPRTRGSPLRSRADPGKPGGSPAHAGIAPETDTCGPVVQRLPRVGARAV